MRAGLDFRNTNTLWGSVLAETLHRCGVQHAVVSPGSRSTPLTVALAAHPGIEAIPVLDERSGGFFALGLARRTGRPVALVCTSGTAAANYLPAVIEARESRVPLLVLTADRPPELRDCAAGQAIDQQKLFGGYPNFYHELAVPEARLELLRYLRQTVAHACERAVRPAPGPVHLNIPFRDPLAPVEDGVAGGLEEGIDEAFFAHLAPAEPVAPGIIVWQRPTTARGLIVAGQVPGCHAAEHARAVRRLAESLRWPVVADVLSPVRHRAAGWSVPVVDCYDAILRNEKAAGALLPRTVLCVGGWPTSKALRQWLERSGAEIVMLDTFPENRDALHGRTRRIPVGVEAFRVDGQPVADDSYVRAWRQAQAEADGALDRALAQDLGGTLFEGVVARTLAEHLPAGTAVFLANSMSVRYAEYFWPANDRAHPVYYSRGANGIDGTLSTAMGVAHGGAPTVLLTGDLAFLHDANGLLNAGRLRGSLTVLLINNDGGGIFEHLPIAGFEPPFETFFATPQQVDFSALCAAHGVPHEIVETKSALAAALAGEMPGGVRVLEVRTDRKADVKRCRQILREASGAVSVR